jgi:molecular chaperone HscA
MARIPIDIKTGKVTDQREIIVGIDLGTTNSMIAYVDGEQPRIIPVGHASNGILPSAIHFDIGGGIVVGHAAKARLVSSPQSTVYSVKRLMGRTASDLTEEQRKLPYTVISRPETGILDIVIDERVYSPVELSSYILKDLKDQASFLLRQEIRKAVITVPAYFSDSQRQATRQAGELAGFEVLRIINEPTAASMAYGIGLSREEAKTVMVYDLGGGTFDVSILRIEDGIFDVLASQGDNFLGGDDIDLAICRHWLKQYAIQEDQQSLGELRVAAENAKIRLSEVTECEIPFRNLVLRLTRTELEELAEPFIEKSIQCCKMALKDSGINVKELDEIVLVGGSTRLPVVIKRLVNEFGIHINDTLHPEQVVALGAAVQADILSGNRRDFLLLDVTPLSIGIETMGGLMDTIIPRNSKLPLRLAKQYTTSRDGQRNIRISVFQGERELVKDNLLLGEFILKGIPPMPAGLPRIELVFSIDVDGILSAKARELRSNQEQELEIRSAFKLGQEEIISRLKESVQFADSDMKNKVLIDARNEAAYIDQNARKFLNNNQALLLPEEVQLILQKLAAMDALAGLEDAEALQHSIDAFNRETAAIAHKVMDIQIQQSLGGSQVDHLT